MAGILTRWTAARQEPAVRAARGVGGPEQLPRRSGTAGEVPELFRNLLLDVERRLALALAALVGGDGQLADLGLGRGVGGRPEQAGELGVHVDGLEPAGDAPVVARLEH